MCLKTLLGIVEYRRIPFLEHEPLGMLTDPDLVQRRGLDAAQIGVLLLEVLAVEPRAPRAAVAVLLYLFTLEIRNPTVAFRMLRLLKLAITH